MSCTTTCRDLEGILLNEMSGSERQILYGNTYMRNLKKYNKQMNITKQKETHSYRELAIFKQTREEGKSKLGGCD